MTRLLLRVSCLALTFISVSLPAAEAGFDIARDDIQSFISSMVRHHRFDRKELSALLRDARPQPRILEAIQRPAEKSLAWWEYRHRFLTDERINGGVLLWQTHRAELEEIASQSGVPAEYLIAITGVETFYGRITGRYHVLDALTTLGFDYPPRAEFFRKELEQFLVMAREEDLDPRNPLGSYAGAMGIPQFMPSSFRRYAVDGSKDGHRNLWEHGPDVFASVANYFKEHGWRAGQPVLAEAGIDGSPDNPATLLLALNESVASLRDRGYRFDVALPDSARAMLIPAALEQGMSWRIGFQNFYVITRYNHSPLYAMAVHELALAIAERYRNAPTPTPVATP
jgi:membrane-bound lytic murein transglycosylase B